MDKPTTFPTAGVPGTVSDIGEQGGSTKKRIKAAIHGSSLYEPARNLYQLLFDRDTLRYRVRMRRFYAQFFQKRDLVFDVGANVGEYSRLFSGLGATVVAVEPNPSCCKSLFEIARTKNVRVEGCAVGETVGSASLRVCDQSYLSTLSNEWFESSRDAATYQNVRWLDQIQVPVVTLDLLAKRHGVPAFVKIDVEGFEENAIKGMTFNPQSISFEFSNVNRDGALHCIERLGARGYKFNPMLSRNFEFQFSHWKSDLETIQWLTQYHGKEEFGDIFARLSC
jgi:FkbM family methyltransferase